MQVKNIQYSMFISRSDESDVTRGSYYINLPDTRTLVVTYYVDADGYHPTITYEGEAVHPEQSGESYGEEEQEVAAAEEVAVVEEVAAAVEE